MRLLTIFLVLLQLVLGIAAVAPQRQILITYPNDTPPSELAHAKSAIEEAVGFVSRACAISVGADHPSGRTHTP